MLVVLMGNANVLSQLLLFESISEIYLFLFPYHDILLYVMIV